MNQWVVPADTDPLSGIIRNEFQQKLMESEEQLTLFVEHSPASLAMFDKHMRYLNVSRKWILDHGLSDQQLIGKSYYEVFPAIPQRWKDIHQRCLTGVVEKSDEDFLTRRDGRMDCVRWKIDPWYKASGEIGGIIIFTEVITEDKSAQEKFIKAFDLSPDLMVIIREKDLVFLEVNRKIEEIAGFTREEVIGFNAAQKGFEIWPNPEERQSFFDEYHAKEKVFLEARFRKKNGEIFHGAVSAQRMILGCENHMIVIIRDITERKENQQKLLASEANLAATINNTAILIWSVDRNFNLLTFNKPFAKYIRETYGIEIRLGARIFGHVDLSASREMTFKWSRYYLRVLRGEIVNLEELQREKYFQYSLSPIIEDDKIIGVSAFAENVTERKHRERDLAEANKKIGQLKLMALRSTMSPHFIFNVLSSIQYFIAKNDKLNAINYLSTFSKLIRSVLSHSVRNTIKLADEIELLKNYVHLEIMRFENRFDFILKVDSRADVDSIEIPSLLIQPYVENAILHGLYNKDGKGTLWIGMREEDGTLIIEIEDDGVGREAAMKLRQHNPPSHESMGIKLTGERLKLINQQHRANVEIIDLIQENVACGTMVKIRIAHQ